MISTETTDRAAASVREKLSVVWIGRSFYSEFQESYSSLDDHFQVRLAADPATVLQWARNPPFNPPTLVILAEDYPRQFNETELKELNSLWPLTQLIQVVNDWCEGDPRSRFGLPSVIRVLKNEFPLWMERALKQQELGYAPSWQQPVTSSVEQLWLEQNPIAHNDRIHPEDKSTRKSTSAAVISHSLEDQLAITDSLKLLGFHSEENIELAATSHRLVDFLYREHQLNENSTGTPDLVIANSHNGLHHERETYDSLRSQWPSASWLFLVNFPREQDAEIVRDWPNSRVLPKPCSLAMLETALNSFNH